MSTGLPKLTASDNAVLEAAFANEDCGVAYVALLGDDRLAIKADGEKPFVMQIPKRYQTELAKYAQKAEWLDAQASAREKASAIVLESAKGFISPDALASIAAGRITAETGMEYTEHGTASVILQLIGEGRLVVEDGDVRAKAYIDAEALATAE